MDKNVRLGRLNSQANATPALFQPPEGCSPSLIVAENYNNWYWACDMFMHVYGHLLNLGTYTAFERGFGTERNLSAFKWDAFNIKSDQMLAANFDLCISFPEKPAHSIAVSYHYLNNCEVKGFKVAFFRQRTVGDSSFWEMDSTLAAFYLSPRLYNRPVLADFDQGGQPELLIRDGTIYSCFKNHGTLEAPDWQPSPAFLNGIDDLIHFHLTMTDLDRDGNRLITMRYLPFLLSLGLCPLSFAAKWLLEHKNMADAVALIFIIKSHIQAR